MYGVSSLVSFLDNYKMFGTLRYDPSEKEPRFIASADSTEFIEAGMPQHSACQNCRERKLRCDGQKPSCGRCINGEVFCRYKAGSERRRRRKDQNPSRDNESSKKDEGLLRGNPKASFAKPQPFRSLHRGPIDNRSPQLPVNLMSPLSTEDDSLMQAVDVDNSASWDGSTCFEDTLAEQQLEDMGTDGADLLFGPLDFSAGGGDAGGVMNSVPFSPARLAFAPESSTVVVPPPYVDTHPLNNCNCNDKALEILDGIDTQLLDLQLPQIINALEHQRKALKQCRDLLLCDDCLRKTTHLTLLTMCFGRIVEFCDYIVTQYLNQKSPSSGKQYVGVKLGGYEIDSQEELIAMLQPLMTLRLEEMLYIIGRVQPLRSHGMKDSHLARLKSAEEWVKRIVARLR